MWHNLSDQRLWRKISKCPYALTQKSGRRNEETDFNQFSKFQKILVLYSSCSCHLVPCQYTKGGRGIVIMSLMLLVKYNFIIVGLWWKWMIFCGGSSLKRKSTGRTTLMPSRSFETRCTIRSRQLWIYLGSESCFRMSQSSTFRNTSRITGSNHTFTQSCYSLLSSTLVTAHHSILIFQQTNRA